MSAAMSAPLGSGSVRVVGGHRPWSPVLPPATPGGKPGGGRSWSETLTSLEEQHESLENIFEQHSRQIVNLMRQHKAGLVQHRQALNQQLTNAHVQLIQQPSPGAGLGAPAPLGSRGWPKSQDLAESDMESDGDSVGDEVGCMAAFCAVPALEGVFPTSEELLNNDEIYTANRKELRAEPGSLQEKAVKVISHCTWPFFTSILILTQTVVLGFLVSREILHLLGTCHREERACHHDAPFEVDVTTIKKISSVLLFMWMMEMIIRIVAGGREFFRYPGGVGNILEVCLLAFALLDVIKEIVPQVGCVADFFGFFRVFRAFRLIRLLNVCQQFKALHRLRWMMLYIATCLPSFFWAVVLLIMVIFIWAILFLDIAILYLQTGADNWKKEIVEGIRLNWAGMNSALMSLTFSLTGGDDYGNLMRPFFLINSMYGWLYILLLITVTLCFFNVVVGIFVQDSEDIVRWDRNLVLTNAVKKNDFTEDILRQLFYEIDNNSTGEISLKEMRMALMRPDIRAWFLHLDIDMASNAKVFFDLLDDDYSGLVNVQEFVNGCARLKGGAKPLSLESLVIETRRLSETVNRMDATLSDNRR